MDKPPSFDGGVQDTVTDDAVAGVGTTDVMVGADGAAADGPDMTVLATEVPAALVAFIRTSAIHPVLIPAMVHVRASAETVPEQVPPRVEAAAHPEPP
jgi:hypothetical protein